MTNVDSNYALHNELLRDDSSGLDKKKKKKHVNSSWDSRDTESRTLYLYALCSCCDELTVHRVIDKTSSINFKTNILSCTYVINHGMDNGETTIMLYVTFV